MRLWSLSPALLDRAALIACWREGLLAQKVLAGGTRGYTRHPQLVRFRASADPLAAIGFFLGELQREATARGYAFNAALITHPSTAPPRIPVTDGQVAYELDWLRGKVRRRDRAWLAVLQDVSAGAAGGAFMVVPGGVEEWERVETKPKERVKAETKPKKGRVIVETKPKEGRAIAERQAAPPRRSAVRRSVRLAASR